MSDTYNVQPRRRGRSDTETARPPVPRCPGEKDEATMKLEEEDADGDLWIHKANFLVSGSNTREKFNNPFHDWEPDDVERVAKKLALFYGIADSIDVFIKAAKVLSKPDRKDWASIGLSAHEKTVLTHEKTTSFWDQPWPLQTTFFVLFVAAAVQGWNQTGTTGANLGWPQDLLYNGTDDKAFLDAHLNNNCVPNGDDTWKFGAVNAIPYLAASIGTFLSDALNEAFFGRRNAILFSAILIFASAAGSAFVKDWESLLGLRALLGIGMGCKAAVVPVFAAEIAPAHLRGTLVMNWQVFDAFGIFLGYTANLIVSQTGTPWRWQLATSCIPTFALICGVIFVRWDSPRFLMKQEEHSQKWHQKITSVRNAESSGGGGAIVIPDWAYMTMPKRVRKHFRPSTAQKYRSQAYKTLLLLRGEPILAAKELIFAHCQLLTEIYTYPSENVGGPAEMQEADQRPSAHSLRPFTPTPDATSADKVSAEPTVAPGMAAAQGSDNDSESISVDYTFSNEDRVDPGDRVNFSLINRTKWFARTRLVKDTDMRYLGRETIAACVVMISQQLCGINVLIFYAASIYSHRGSTNECSQSFKPLLLCWGIGLTNFLFALPAYRWIETMGRKWLPLATLPFLSLLIAAAAASFQAPGATLQQILIGVFTYLFTAVYSFGMGPVPFTYSAEIFPLEHRIIGMSIAVSVNLLGAGILAFFVPAIQIGTKLLGIFAGLNLCAFVAIWKLVPETIGAAAENDTKMTALDLSQLFYIFKRPNSSHRRYMSEYYFYYFWPSLAKVLTFRNDFEAPDPFYQWNLNLDNRDRPQSS